MITPEELAKLSALLVLVDPGLKVRCSPEDTSSVKVVFELANQVPDLIEEIHRLRREAAEHHDELTKADDVAAEQRKEILQLRTVVDALRAWWSRDPKDNNARWASVIESLNALDSKPVPMCRPDALEDLFPRARGEGGGQ